MIVIPVYNMTLAPNATVYFSEDQVRRNASGKSISSGEKVIMIVAKENGRYDELTEESFYPIGLAGVISDVSSQKIVSIRTQYRVNVQDVWIDPDKTISLTVSRRPEIEDIEESVEKEKLTSLLQEMRDYAAGFEWGDQVEYWLRQIRSVEMAACLKS